MLILLILYSCKNSSDSAVTFDYHGTYKSTHWIVVDSARDAYRDYAEYGGEVTLTLDDSNHYTAQIFLPDSLKYELLDMDGDIFPHDVHMNLSGEYDADGKQINLDPPIGYVGKQLETYEHSLICRDSTGGTIDTVYMGGIFIVKNPLVTRYTVLKKS